MGSDCPQWSKLIAKPSNKPNTRPCYTVMTEEGEVLVRFTGHPLADGAAALLTKTDLPRKPRLLSIMKAEAMRPLAR